MKEIKNIVIELANTTVANNKYYSLLSLLEVLSKLEEDIFLEDIIIIPYYIYNNRVMELYDYELNIRVIDKPDVEKYILQRTGKQSIKEIEPRILNKLKNCYIGLDRKNGILTTNMLIQYIHYVLDSTELQDRVEKSLGDFSESEYYFELH